MHYAWHSLASSQSLIYTISVRRPTCTQPESCSVSSKRLQTTRLVLLPTFCHQPPWKDSHKDVSVLEELKENRLAIHKPPNPPPPHFWNGVGVRGGGWSKFSKLIFACNSAMILQTASKDVLSAAMQACAFGCHLDHLQEYRNRWYRHRKCQQGCNYSDHCNSVPMFQCPNLKINRFQLKKHTFIMQ